MKYEGTFWRNDFKQGLERLLIHFKWNSILHPIPCDNNTTPNTMWQVGCIFQYFILQQIQFSFHDVSFFRESEWHFTSVTLINSNRFSFNGFGDNFSNTIYIVFTITAIIVTTDKNIYFRMKYCSRYLRKSEMLIKMYFTKKWITSCRLLHYWLLIVCIPGYFLHARILAAKKCLDN